MDKEKAKETPLMYSPIEETRQRVENEASQGCISQDEGFYEMGRRDASRATADTLVSRTMMKHPAYKAGYEEVMEERQIEFVPAFVTRVDERIDEEF